jgi:hypothetical protein
MTIMSSALHKARVVTAGVIVTGIGATAGIGVALAVDHQQQVRGQALAAQTSTQDTARQSRPSFPQGLPQDEQQGLQQDDGFQPPLSQGEQAMPQPQQPPQQGNQSFGFPGGTGMAPQARTRGS